MQESGGRSTEMQYLPLFTLNHGHVNVAGKFLVQNVAHLLMVTIQPEMLL